MSRAQTSRVTSELNWCLVTCRECHAEYHCTPAFPYYGATNTRDGLCGSCHLRAVQRMMAQEAAHG